MVTVVVAAPVLEELLLRGIILDGLLKIYSPKKAIIWSALFFGFFHLNPWQFIPAFALGLFMGWIYYRTRSLMTTIFIHFVANSAGVILGYFFLPEAQEMAPTRSFFPSDASYFGLLAAALVILVFALQMLNKKLPSISASTNKPL